MTFVLDSPTTSSEETFHQDFQEILKRLLENLKEMFLRSYMDTGNVSRLKLSITHICVTRHESVNSLWYQRS